MTLPLRLLLSLVSVLAYLSLSFPAEAALSSQSDADRLFIFAGSLMKEDDFYRAITEFKRFISYFPEDERVPLSRLNIALAYKRGGKIDLAVEQLHQIEQDYRETAIAGRASYEIGAAYFSSGRYEEAGEAFSAFLKAFPTSPRLDSAKIYLGWTWIHSWKLGAAVRVFSEVSEKSPYYPFSQALAKEIEGGFDLPRKSPLLAGTFSALLPGSGQIYTGRYNEGVTSFILNGAFIWAIAELFTHSNEAAGILLGFFEVGWYTGGVFGAVNDAHKFNRKARNDYILNLGSRYPLPPGD